MGMGMCQWVCVGVCVRGWVKVRVYGDGGRWVDCTQASCAATGLPARMCSQSCAQGGSCALHLLPLLQR